MAQTSTDIVDLNEVLIIEAHHRFFNSLQVITALANRLTRVGLPSEVLRLTAAEIVNRVSVLGEVHRLLARPHGLDLPTACETLCTTLASAYDRSDVKLHLSIPPLPMSASMSRGFMLLLSELTTNALKHSPIGVPFELDIILTGTASGYQLVVHSPRSSGGLNLTSKPRVASQLAMKLGGDLTIDTACGYLVRVSLPGECPHRQADASLHRSV